MFKTVSVIALASAVLLAAGCGRKPAPTVNASMTQVMAPQAQTIWDITSHAFNDKGDGLDGSKISEADWVKLADAGRRLQERAMVLAKAHHITAAAPGEIIMGGEAAGAPSPIGHTWDAANASKVQGFIDGNPALFAQRAQILAEAGAALAKAARTKDVRTAYQVSSNLDEDCDGCHKPFWGTDEPPPFPH